MINSVKVLLVDGPYRGKIVSTDYYRGFNYIYMVDTSEPTPFFSDPTKEPITIKQLAYKIQEVDMFGKIIYIGYLNNEDKLRNAYELLASDIAKELNR